MENKPTTKKSKFSKNQVLKSNQFSNAEKCLLSAILKDEESYSSDEVKSLLEKEKKRGVK
ncbi:MAG: hypothetical protein AB7V16_08810 [Vulcanibacillus sp.]